jgi:hypothetical protein
MGVLSSDSSSAPARVIGRRRGAGSSQLLNELEDPHLAQKRRLSRESCGTLESRHARPVWMLASMTEDQRAPHESVIYRFSLVFARARFCRDIRRLLDKETHRTWACSLQRGSLRTMGARPFTETPHFRYTPFGMKQRDAQVPVLAIMHNHVAWANRSPRRCVAVRASISSVPFIGPRSCPRTRGRRATSAKDF